MNGTAWVEHLAAKDRALHEQRKHQAALNVIAYLGYPPADDPVLLDLLEQIGVKGYQEAVRARVEQDKQNERKRDRMRKQRAKETAA